MQWAMPPGLTASSKAQQGQTDYHSLYVLDHSFAAIELRMTPNTEDLSAGTDKRPQH